MVLTVHLEKNDRFAMFCLQKVILRAFLVMLFGLRLRRRRAGKAEFGYEAFGTSGDLDKRVANGWFGGGLVDFEGFSWEFGALVIFVSFFKG